MFRSDFSYPLPADLIAQHPLPNRTDSRLLVLDAGSGAISDHRFVELPSFVDPGDLMVFNDTQVLKARLYGRKATGGRVEALVERVLANDRLLAHVRASKAPKPGSKIGFGQAVCATVVDRHDCLFELQFEDSVNVYQILERIGETPLPFYIKRQAEAHDAERYQTVYARYPGAIAAPTAGLHFDAPLLDTLRRRRVQLAFVTLHVAAGTFQPVRAERIEEHRMHTEYAAVSAQVCERIIETKKRGGRVIAVGTTTVRALESAALAGKPRAFHADTGVFIYPGHTFRCVDAIITNFHLPESSLLMLVSAFAGLAPLLRAYRHAVAQGYRFFSYGDAMLVARNNLTQRGF